MNRTELERLSKERLEDAKILLANGRWTAAFYIAGYAVEIGLKSCVLRHLDATGVIFKDKEYLKNLANCWTHELEKLIKLANLEKEFGIARGANPALEAHWNVTKDWMETSRYEQKTEREARDLLEAVDHNPNGVFLWIQTHW